MQVDYHHMTVSETEWQTESELCMHINNYTSIIVE